MQFCKLEIFNLAYLYVLYVLTTHFGREQNCLKCQKIETYPFKSYTKLKFNTIVKKDKTNRNERKSSKKEKEKRKKKKKTKIDRYIIKNYGRDI